MQIDLTELCTMCEGNPTYYFKDYENEAVAGDELLSKVNSSKEKVKQDKDNYDKYKLSLRD